MFSRIAIVNRGEAAMRLIHAVRELTARTGAAVETVAFYTDSERTAAFAREADHAVGIGPASARPYLDHDVLARALTSCRADAAWVGWGFVAEDPSFAELCATLGVTFVGPSPEAMRALGDKIGAKHLAEKVGVPVAPWSDGEVAGIDEALRQARIIGYPLMLKAAAGGGGRGIRVVTSGQELRDVFERTRQEARRAFGSGVVFLEKLVTGARHVEVQVIADGTTAWALGVRDCSVQRRNQKLIEESASPVLDAGQVAAVKEAAERLALAVDYCGAGTVEFLYHPGSKALAFLEVNTRLQVEHAVTELTTGLDLVGLQLHVASGGTLDGPRPSESGHAVEARLNAEDPDRDFAPAPGRIAWLRLPVGPGVRVDTGVWQGDTIPADFDSMIAKIVAHGPTRDVALARLSRALEDTGVVIEGGTTNKSFLLDLLGARQVRDGSADTGWIDRVRTTGGLVNHAHAGVALVAAAIEAYDAEEAVERRRFLATAHGGRPQAGHDVARVVDLKLRGAAYRVGVAQTAPSVYRARVTASAGGAGAAGGEGAVEASMERLDAHTGRLRIGERIYRVVLASHRGEHLVEVHGVSHRVSRDSGGVLRSPAPALVVSVPVAVGEEVAAGAPVVVLESMKMETVVVAPATSRVRELLVTSNAQVEAGAPLVRLEPLGDAAPAGADSGGGGGERIDLPGSPAPATADERALACLADVRALILGFDLGRDDGRAAVAAYRRCRPGARLLAAELDVLQIFADLCELTRNRPVQGELADVRVHSPREHFHAYLHSLDIEREHLPGAFRERLARMLGHYGVSDLARTPDLEEAVFRVFLAQQGAGAHAATVPGLLEPWLREDAPSGADADRAREVLDRLVLATQLRYPVLGDLARSIRFRWFEAPLVEAYREAAYDDVREHLAHLAEQPVAPDHAARIEALVAGPEPVVRFLAERLAAGGGRGMRVPEPLLEVLARRQYGDCHLTDVREHADGGVGWVTADYVLDDRPTHRPSHLVTIATTMDRLREAADIVERAVAQAPAGRQCVVDLYLGWPQAPLSLDESSAQLREVLGALPLARTVRRIAVVAAAPAPSGEVVMHQFTFRPDEAGQRSGRTAEELWREAGGEAGGEAGRASTGVTAGIHEDLLVRGLHPMIARRLDLWRLRDFDIKRLPAPDGILLYHCVAPQNPADQRLVALAQVRELAVVRDAAGTITAVPQAERAIAACMDGIRRARTAAAAIAGPGGRLDMNHVWLHIWPVVDTPVEQLTALQRSIAPLTVGAGVEEVVVRGRVPADGDGVVEAAARFSYQPGQGVVVTVNEPALQPLAPMDEYAQKVLRSRRRGTVYPYELVPLLTGDAGLWAEYDLDAADGTAARAVPVDRPRGRNRAGVVLGVVTTPSDRYPDGVRRVVLAGDPTMALGAVAEPECARICAALDLAGELGVPVEWFALSAGARISMDSGTENMDWVARALRRIIEFTQDGGEINVIVTGINVGAQPYWNAEATMLMHTKGILVMTPDSAMVLTGKQSLDYSGGVSAEDNFGIGGYDRVMGPNGQAQYWAPDLATACEILMRHYDHAYVAPGERFSRAVNTADPPERDVCTYPHDVPDSEFRTVGDIFSALTNPERKKAFDIRTVLRAVADADRPTLERWADMADADTSVVLDAHLGGIPVCLMGVESRPIARRGFPPSDGPDAWTGGTLFPRSSKKTARAVNAASGSRPLVVLANLSGFDGSPESMRRLQLEYGAEIGRAVVNFRGPIVFCVVSRYHGGAFVVFSKALHDNMQVLAVEGSYASVIGGAPAAAVVFSAEVDARTSADPRVRESEVELADAGELDRPRLRADLAELRRAVRSEKLGEVAAEFDGIHSIARAVGVGSVDDVVGAHELRPRLIEAVERGLSRA